MGELSRALGISRGLKWAIPGLLGYWACAAEAGPARIVTGPDAGGAPTLQAFTGQTHTVVGSIFAYSSGFTGGVRVACGDVNGDGGPDLITGSGPGATHVKVFAGGGLQEVMSFFAYPLTFTGGIFVAAGDVDGDGFADIVTGPDQDAGPNVKVFSGATGAEIRSFFAYSTGFTGGVRVAAGDVNGDGFADIITATGVGGGPHVKVFSGVTGTEIYSFFAYAPSFTGGVYVAAGDLNGDGRADIVTTPGSGTSEVRAFNGATGAQFISFSAYTPVITGGVRVAAGDVDGDGLAEILTVPGPGAGSQVRIFDSVTLAERDSFYAYTRSFSDGVFIGASSLVRPQLQIAALPTPGKLQLTWQAGFITQLQSATQLGNPAGWTNVPTQPSQTGKQMKVPVTATQPAEFFRLSYDEETTP